MGYSVDLAMALGTFALVAATAWWAEIYIVHSQGVASLMLIYAVAFLPRSFATTSRAALTVFGKFPAMASVDLVSTIIRVGVILGLVIGGWGVAGVIWGNAIGMAVSGIFLGLFTYPLIGKEWGGSWISSSWKDLKGFRREIVHFFAFTNVSELVGLFAKQADMVILGYFRGPQEAGYYRLAKSLSSVVGYIVQPLQQVAYPRLAHLWGAGHRAQMGQTVRRYALWVGVPLAILVLSVIPAVHALMGIIVGEEYLPAVRALQFLLAGSAVWLAFFWLRPVYHALGEVKFWLINATIISILTVIGYVIAAPQWGHVGIAVVWFLAGGIGGHLIAAVYFLLRVKQKSLIFEGIK